jgi:hypothetical protein
LQVCTAVLALIPIATGIVTLLGVRDPIYRPLGLPSAPILDTSLRFALKGYLDETAHYAGHSGR